MKKQVLAFLCVLACLLAACDSPEPSSIPSSSGSTVLESTEEPPQSTIPALADLKETELPELDFDPRDLLHSPIPLEYEVRGATESFMEALRNMDELAYQRARDGTEFFNFDGYVLFPFEKSIAGPSEILVEHPDGTLESVFSCTQPIARLYLTEVRTQLVLALAEVSGGDGFVGKNYLLDLEALTLNEIPNISALSSLGIWENAYYCGYFYSVENFFDELGSINFFLYDAAGRELKRWEKLSSYDLSGGAFYYTDETAQHLFRVALHSRAEEQIFTFPHAVDDFKIYGEQLIYWASGRLTMVNLDTMQEITLHDVKEPLAPLYYFCEDGYYFMDVRDKTLTYISYRGSSQVLLSNFFPNSNFAVLDGWLYFEFYHSEAGQFTYWKVQLTGENLTQLVWQ